jgi:hypothetical protein
MKDLSSLTGTTSRHRVNCFEVHPHPGPPSAWGQWYEFLGELLTATAADGPNTSRFDGSDVRQIERLYRTAYLETASAAALGCVDFEQLAELYTATRETIKYSDLVRVWYRGGELLLRCRRHGLVLAPLRARSQAAAHMAAAAKAYAEVGMYNHEFRARMLPPWIKQLELWCASTRLRAVLPPRIPAPSERFEQRSRESARNSGAGF